MVSYFISSKAGKLCKMAFRDSPILAIVPPLCLQRFQVGFEVEILDIPACFSFLNGSAESCNLLFILFQPSEAGPNHLAGIRIPSSKDTGLDEGVKAFFCLNLGKIVFLHN